MTEKINKEEFEEQKRQVLEEQKRFLEDNPELGRWVGRKKLLRRLLMGWMLVHFIFVLIIMSRTDALQGAAVGTEVVKLLFSLLWIAVFLNPAGGWKMNLIVYVWAASNFAVLITNWDIYKDFALYFSLMPVISISMLMEILVPFLLLLIAVYLTAIPKHRDYSQQVEQNYKETMQKMQNALK